MEPLRLNRTEDCSICRKTAARWSLLVDFTFGPEWTEIPPRENVLFCPLCDQFTPEDLEVADKRTITLPRPTQRVGASTAPYQMTFPSALAYRVAMGPQRPFRPAGGKTMRRRYNSAGMEIMESGE